MFHRQHCLCFHAKEFLKALLSHILFLVIVTPLRKKIVRYEGFNLQKVIITFICQFLDILPLSLTCALELATSGLSVSLDSKLDIGQFMGLWET